MRAPRVVQLLLAAVFSSLPLPATALPVTYFFTSGSVTITGTVAGGLVTGPVTTALSGVAVTVDEGVLTLNSLSLSMGSTGSVAITPAYNGFTSFNVDFGSLSATGGLLTLVGAGPPTEYGYSIGPVTVTAQIDAVNVIPVNSLTDAPFGFVSPSASGTLFIDPGAGTLELDGITIGQIDPDGAGGLDPLVIKGDFVFSGAVVPEPHAILLQATAFLAALAVARATRGPRPTARSDRGN